MLDLNHKKLEVYKKTAELVKSVYKVSSEIPQSELYGLISQIRRSAISILSNISEGASRKPENERKRFYEISRSSLVELDTQIDMAFSLGFIKIIPKDLNLLMNEVFAMLSKMSK